MMLEHLFKIGLIVAFFLATLLSGYGVFAAITGRNISSGKVERIRIFGCFSLRSHGGPIGFVFVGVALLAACLIILSRHIPTK
jgi:hypothetical protein